MRLDAHQHFWSYDAVQYPWIPLGSPLHRSWLPDDLAALQKPLGFDGSIAVQARQIVGESDWLLGLADTHAKGIRFGPDYDNLDDRPEMDDGALVDPDNIDTDYDSDGIQFPSTWAADLRVCLKAQAPRPCTVLAVKLVIEV